ncbi:MAG: proton-conducting transporter membrane subunit [Candidatus Margulisiibacteriota bacterium]
MQPILIAALVLIPVFSAFAVLLLARWARWFLDAAAIITILLLLGLISGFYIAGAATAGQVYCLGNGILGINLILDGLSSLLLLTVAIIALAIVVYSFAYINKFTAKGKYYALLLLMLAGMNGIILSGDLFNLYIFIELLALASYALVAFGCEKEELEAALKYMLLGSLASLLILLGVVLVYTFAGTLNLPQLSQLLHSTLPTPASGAAALPNYILPGIPLALALFLAGFGIKAALVPFHTWLPDAHPSAPAPISAALSGLAIKAAGAYAITRIVFSVFGLTPQVSQILITLGVISMVVGVLLALAQWDFKRLLAWHSISQMGYILLGIGLGTPLGILGGIFHLINHSVFKSLLFLNAGAVEYATGTRDLKKLGGLSKKMPVTAATSLVASLSISGIPPFNGFWSKLLIIFAAVFAGQYLYAALAAVVSILTLASFAKIQKYVFFGSAGVESAAVGSTSAGSTPDLQQIKEVPAPMQVAMVFLAVLCVLCGIFYPLIISQLLNPAVISVLDINRYAQYSELIPTPTLAAPAAFAGTITALKNLALPQLSLAAIFNIAVAWLILGGVFVFAAFKLRNNKK